MSQDFTEYVRALGRSGEPPSQEAFERLWTALRKALRSEIRRRGLWHHPPHYLGVLGSESWAEDGAPGDALEELVADCYEYVFLIRAQSLKAQLLTKPGVEGLVFRSIRNFLFERQRQHDPLGFRTFEVLRLAVRRTVSEEWLHVVGGDARIRNNTLLGFDRDRLAAGATDHRLAAAVAAWSQDLLPDLVTLRGKAQEKTVSRLADRLRRLEGMGFETFSFGDLIGPLKKAIRSQWAALYGQSLGATAVETDEEGLSRIVRLVSPYRELEERDAFRGLADCVLGKLDRVETEARTHDQLIHLWRFLTAYAVESGFGGDHRFPSGRSIASHLRIPRDKLPQLFRVVGEAIGECRPARS